MDFPLKRQADDFGADPKRQKVAPPSKVLHVRGLPAYTTEAELVSVVAQYGQVVRTLILHDKHQAFIQMESAQAASDAVTALEFSPPSIRSKTFYVQFSSRQEVESKNSAATAAMATGVGGVADASASSTIIIAISNVAVPVTLDNIHVICQPYGEVLKIITFNKNLDFQALVQFNTVEQATNAKLFLDGKDLFQGCCHLRVSFSKRQNLTIKQNDHKSRDFSLSSGALMPMRPGLGGSISGGMQQMAASAGMQNLGFPVNQGGSPVVLVNKLDDKVTPDILFTLFGVYGDVLRVKILFNKHDTAMVQFASSQQAQMAQQNLSGCPLFGQQILVTLSKHQNVALPREVSEEEGKQLTRDFSNSEFHRFKKKQFVNPKNVNPPSQVLHIANIHETTTDQDLRDLFATQQPGARPPVVEFFKNSKSMAYIGMNSIEEAVVALIQLHNYKVNGYPLRVSFSHKDVNALGNGQAELE